jgi:hypothetical protein
MGGRRALSLPCTQTAAAFIGMWAALKRSPGYSMNETSNLNEERQLDVSAGAVKRLILDGMERYNEAVKSGYKYGEAYYDGYIRALKHVLEAENE